MNSGVMKKKCVVQLLESIITTQYGQEVWEQNEGLVESFIEVAIAISKHEIV